MTENQSKNEAVVTGNPYQYRFHIFTRAIITTSLWIVEQKIYITQ